jgi:phosphatidylinositol alpha-1,6-mannosyltransferase
MKFLLITLEYPPMIGGVANYLKDVCRALGKDNCLVYGPSILARFFWPKWLPAMFSARKIIREKKVDMVLISHVLPMGYLALIYKKFFGIPYIVFTHGMDILIQQKSRWKQFWIKKIIKNARGVVANSEFTRAEVLKLGVKKDKTATVYPCPNQNIKLLRFKGGFNGKKVILSVGRLVKRKGVDKVIEAMPKILESVPEAVYFVVGSGSYKKELVELKNKLNLGDKVVFTENTRDEEMNFFYASSDVFAMPARRIGGDVEGFGIVYLEAALFGKPSVAGNVGGAPEAVLDGITGLIVNPESAEEIAEAIIKLLKDDVFRAKIGEAAKNRVMNEFVFEKQMEKMKHLIW